MAPLQLQGRAAPQDVVACMAARNWTARNGRRALPMVEEVGVASADADDEAFTTRGWYESSWDLQRGLDVCEGLPLDLPMDVWFAN